MVSELLGSMIPYDCGGYSYTDTMRRETDLPACIVLCNLSMIAVDGMLDVFCEIFKV